MFKKFLSKYMCKKLAWNLQFITVCC